MRSAAVLDALLLLFADDSSTFGSLLQRFQSTFQSSASETNEKQGNQPQNAKDGSNANNASSPATSAVDSTSCSAFEAACECCELIDSNHSTELASLRPQQRLAALYTVAHAFPYADASNSATPAVTSPPLSSNPAISADSSSSSHSWSSHPFLLFFLRQLEKHEVYLQPPPTLPANTVRDALIERCFILCLLSPPLAAQMRSRSPNNKPIKDLTPRMWTEEVMQAIQMHPTFRLSAFKSDSNVTQLLQPLQLAAKKQQQSIDSSRALISASSSSDSSSSLGIKAQIDLPAAQALTILGEQTLQSIKTVITPLPNSSTAPMKLQLSLSLTPASFLPPPPLVDIQWEHCSDVTDPFSGEFGSELSWMKWDPPESLSWDFQPVVVAAPSPTHGLSLTSDELATPFATLLTKALKSQLMASERATLTQDFKTMSSTFSSAAVSSSTVEPGTTLYMTMLLLPPSKLPQLVEKNHEVAREFLTAFIAISLARTANLAANGNTGSTSAAKSFSFLPSSTSSSSSVPFPSINDYLSQLVQMDMSLHSMELVKDLALVDQVILPPDFLHLYICKCLNSCSKLNDKFLQNRHVRLICVFLQALLRHKIIQLPTNSGSTTNSAPVSAAAPASDSASTSNSSSASSGSSSSSSAAMSAPTFSYDAGSDVRDVLLVEVQSFLVEFSRIKEAANLYKQIKQMEATAS